MGNKPKKTVVLLAETPETHLLHLAQWLNEKEKRKEVSASEFVKQAHWWKNKHKEFNVVVMPFYRGGGDEYSLESAISKINLIANESGGKVTIGFMGHSGGMMGGYPYDEKYKEERIQEELLRLKLRSKDKEIADIIYSQVQQEMNRIGIKPDTRLTYRQKRELEESHIASSREHQHAYMDLVGYKIVPSTVQNKHGFSDYSFHSYSLELDSDPPFDPMYRKAHVPAPPSWDYTLPPGADILEKKEPINLIASREMDMNEERKYTKGEINSIKSYRLLPNVLNPISNKIDGIMIGSCSMGMCSPNEMQDLSNSLGVPVYAQSGTSWGTGAIETIGDEPYEKFFVVGKDDAGMKYIPFQSTPVAMIRSTDPQEKANFILNQWNTGTRLGSSPRDVSDYKRENNALSIELGIKDQSDIIFDMISEQGASPLGF